MTTTQTRTAPSRRVPPAARQPGPVTLAIRALRPNEAPTWEQRQREIDAEEREAMRALRRRVAKAVSDGIDFLDATGGDPDLEDGADNEPSLCGSEGSVLRAHHPSLGGDDREDDAGDNPEEENEHASDCDRGEDSLGSLNGTATGIDLAEGAWSAGRPGDFEADIQSEPHDAEEDASDEDLGGEETLGWAANVGQLNLGPNTADGDATALETFGGGFRRSGHEDDEDSHDREHDEAERGIGDAEGREEQYSFTRYSYAGAA
nr:hypothetical protein NG677_04180 [Methylobacterium sp. OTU13CASTA1]